MHARQDNKPFVNVAFFRNCVADIMVINGRGRAGGNGGRDRFVYNFSLGEDSS